MLLATISSSIILIALDIFRRLHLDPLTPANTNYLLRTTACLLVGCASVVSPERTFEPQRDEQFDPLSAWKGVMRSVRDSSAPKSVFSSRICAESKDRLWSLAGATSGNRWQLNRPRKPGKTSQNRCRGLRPVAAEPW